MQNFAAGYRRFLLLLLAQRAGNSRAGVIASRDASVPLRRHTTVSLVARSRGLHREPVSEGAPLDWTGGPPRHEALHGVVLSNRPPNFYTAAMRVAVSRRSEKSRWRMDTLRGIGGNAVWKAVRTRKSWHGLCRIHILVPVERGTNV